MTLSEVSSSAAEFMEITISGSDEIAFKLFKTIEKENKRM
jgi:hypothetical protein